MSGTEGPKDGVDEADEDGASTVVPGARGDITVTVARGSPPPRESAFVPGDTVSGRYHIRRFIAFGGMGEVYEAEDLVLRQLVALKTIRSEVADDEAILDRFKREILLARKVTHKNVCRIFDLGMHAPPGSPPQIFLTMELLGGETVGDRLRMGHVYKLDEARELVEQMAEALDAAHREGIVHRDFKSGNVMVSRTEKDGLRVVVTDFGLARSSDGDPFSTHAGASTEMMGSPAYMAPEQVEGGRVDKAADLYALGIVMFEMVTGEVPFKGETAMSCAVKRIKEAAPSPRLLVPDLPVAWERTILRCLEREPDNRFASARDVVRSLDGDEVTPAARLEISDHLRGLPPPPRRVARRRRWPLAVAALAVAAAAGGWLLTRARSPAAAVETARAGSRRAIAVLGFKNLAGKPDVAWLSTALAEMLTTEMSVGGELRTIPGETLARMKKELGLAEAESFAPDTLQRIHRNIGADFVLVGSYVPLGDRFRLDVRLQSTATGETLAQVREDGTEAELAVLVEQIGVALRDKLSVGRVTDGELALVHAALPRKPEAARQYAEGLDRLRIFAAREAREHLERAIEIEPGFPQAHAALSEALSYLGYEAPAREAARRAMELGASLPERERLRVEGLYHTSVGDTSRAAKVYATLFEREPDNLEWGMRLASAQFALGDDPAASRTIEQLRKLPGADDDPRIHMVLMQAAMMKARFDEVRELAGSLAAAGAARGATSLIGEAKHLEAVALWFQGELPASVEAAEQARQLSFRLGDRDGVAAATTTKAFVLTELGRYVEARAAAQAALDVAAEVGSRRRIWLAEHVLARCGLFGGDLSVATRHYEASREAANEIGSRYGEALALLGTAVTLAAQGELARAEPIYDRMSLGFRLFAPEHNQGFFNYFRANLALAQGKLGDAREGFERTVSLSVRFGERLQGERARVGLALTDLVEGKPAEAEGHARRAQKAFEELEAPDDVAAAGAVLARALLAEGRVQEAEAALAGPRARAELTETIFVRMAILRAQAEALSGAGRNEQALALLAPLIEEASTRGYVGESLELRLVRAVALARSKQRDAARAERNALLGEARRLGFGTIVARAEAVAP